MKGRTKIRTFSNIFQSEYDTDDVRYIPNMQQNYKYLNSPLSQGQLADIICGNDNRLVFVWKKSLATNKLYQQWCDYKL